MKIAKLIFISIITTFILIVSASQSTSALNVNDNCSQVEIVFVRGSGQDLKASEAERFRAKVEGRIKSPTEKHYYELGTETYGGHKYQAIDVDNALNGNPIGAAASSGYAFDYGRSVDSGVGELYSYLEQRNKKCPNARIVLGGYSQGAQVVGQTLPKLSSTIQDKIDFTALFGDPKLHLPEGEGVYPDACRGKNFSSWRRTIGDCHADNGSLGARKPYLPTAMASKTGLWCNAVDFVCGTSKFLYDTAGHGKYKREGGAIDKAAIEIAQKVKGSLPVDQGSGIDTGVPKPGLGTTGLDVAFVLDTTGSMGSRITQAKTFIRNSAQKIKELNGRVSLTVYRDSGDAYTAQVLSGLQSDTAELLAKLDAVSLDGGGDTPEATLHALKTTFDGLAWKDGATKAAIVLTDAGFHQPDRVDDSTVESVAKRSLEIDPVNVYPVVPSGVAPQYHELASKTTGQVIVDTGDTVAALTQALSKIETRPTALLKNTEYSAEPGKEVTYDASDSYVVDATITKYEWDINGDGTFEYTTTTPIVSHTYSANLDGTMQVRLTASNGTVANASAFVKIGTKELPQTPKAPTNITANVISTKDQKSTITLNWTPADTFATKWIIAVNGVEIGYVTGNRTSLDLTDVDRTLDVELSITGATVKNELGNPGTTILAKYVTPRVQPPTTNSWLLQLIECVRRLLASLGILI